jgi:hypothetical protein
MGQTGREADSELTVMVVQSWCEKGAAALTLIPQIVGSHVDISSYLVTLEIKIKNEYACGQLQLDA